MENFKNTEVDYPTWMVINTLDQIYDVNEFISPQTKQVYPATSISIMVYNWYAQRLFGISFTHEETQLMRAKELLLVLLGEINWEKVRHALIKHLKQKEETEELWQHYRSNE